MNAHINGWNLVQMLLDRNGKNQSWLAKQLKMSPAAVTQVKQGVFRLSGDQIAKICQVTGATKEEKDELYSEVVNARLFNFVPKATVKVNGR